MLHTGCTEDHVYTQTALLTYSRLTLAARQLYQTHTARCSCMLCVPPLATAGNGSTANRFIGDLDAFAHRGADGLTISRACASPDLPRLEQLTATRASETSQNAGKPPLSTVFKRHYLEDRSERASLSSRDVQAARRHLRLSPKQLCKRPYYVAYLVLTFDLDLAVLPGAACCLQVTNQPGSPLH